MTTTTKLDLAEKFRQNWQSQYPFLNQPKIERKVFQPSLLRNTYKNMNAAHELIDDSLTNLNWLQNLNLFSMPPSQPPLSPPPINNHYIQNVPPVVKPPPVQINPSRIMPPYFETSSIYAEVSKNLEFMIDEASVQFFKANNQLRPPFSDISLISMAIYSHNKQKVSFPEICSWIEDTFPYYQKLPADWKVDIKNNLTLSKCFQKVPRRKDETEKGGFWRFSNEFLQYIQRNSKLSDKCAQIINQSTQLNGGTHSNPMTPTSLNSPSINNSPTTQDHNQFIRNCMKEEEIISINMYNYNNNNQKVPIITSSGCINTSPIRNNRKRTLTDIQSQQLLDNNSTIPPISCVTNYLNDPQHQQQIDALSAFKIPRKDNNNIIHEQNSNYSGVFYDEQQLPILSGIDTIDKTKLMDQLSVFQNLTVCNGNFSTILPSISPDTTITSATIIPSSCNIIQNSTIVCSIDSNSNNNNHMLFTTSPIINNNNNQSAFSQLPQLIENTKGFELFNNTQNLLPINYAISNKSHIDQTINNIHNQQQHHQHQQYQNSSSPCPEQITEEEFLSGKAFAPNFLNNQGSDENLPIFETSLNDLSITGVGIKPPDWWNQSLSASQLSISKLGFSLRSLTGSSNNINGIVGPSGERSSPFGVPGGPTTEEGVWVNENNIEELDMLFGLN